MRKARHYYEEHEPGTAEILTTNDIEFHILHLWISENDKIADLSASAWFFFCFLFFNQLNIFEYSFRDVEKICPQRFCCYFQIQFPTRNLAKIISVWKKYNKRICCQNWVINGLSFLRYFNILNRTKLI